MKNFRPFSITNSPSSQPPTWLVICFVVVALVGFADAAFLTAKYYLGGPIPCAILNGCETVTTSKYATVLQMPVALFGAIYYLSILVLALVHLDLKKYKFMGAAARLTVVGFLASIWFVSLQVFVLNALCLYCIASAGSSTLLFILGFGIIKRHEN